MKTEKQNRQVYPSDLTDAQWEVIKPLYSNMRVYKWSKRELTNALMYVVKTGCQWRQLPHDFPPFQTVYSFYRRAKEKNLWDKMLELLVEKSRQQAGRDSSPSYAIIDSQSVKSVYKGEERGFDGHKKNQGSRMGKITLALGSGTDF